MSQIALTKPFMSQNGVKNGFHDPGVELNSFSSVTILIDVIKINQLKF